MNSNHTFDSFKRFSVVVAVISVAGLCLGGPYTAHGQIADGPVADGPVAENLVQYDSALLPITEEDLKVKIEQDKDNPINLFQLVRRSATQKHLVAAFKALSELRVNNPKNANILSAYRLAFDLATSSREPLADFKPTEEEVVAWKTALDQAYIIAPDLWFPYAVEGSYLSDKPGLEEKSFSLLKKAVDLAPNVSITHYLLSSAYLVYGTPFTSVEFALDEAKKASDLKPVLSKAPRNMLFIYSYSKPNKEKALLAKKKFLETIPPSFEIDQATKSLLGKIE